jgi:hypothetical protein
MGSRGFDSFEQSANGMLRIVEPNLDECGFCDLCIQRPPGKMRLVKLYA